MPLSAAILKRRRRNSLSTTVAVLTLIEDGLEEVSPFYSLSSSKAGTLRIDFHTASSPSPAAGAGNIATTTQAIGTGITVFTWDLSAYAGQTGYLHFRCINSAGESNILVSQVITVPSSISTGLYMEDGSSFILMEDNSSIVLMEG